MRLPPENRSRLGIRAGTRLDLVGARGSARELKGLLPLPARPLSLDEMEKAIAKGARGQQ